MAILVAFFAGFAVNDDPDGVLAHVCAFIPFTAPITMPGRIALGEVPLWEIAASVAVMITATALMIPLAARIYAATVMRTGSAVKLSEALRLARHVVWSEPQSERLLGGVGRGESWAGRQTFKNTS